MAMKILSHTLGLICLDAASKYSLTELENMIPWEREVYLTFLHQYIEEENLKAKQAEMNG